MVIMQRKKRGRWNKLCQQFSRIMEEMEAGGTRKIPENTKKSEKKIPKNQEKCVEIWIITVSQRLGKRKFFTEKNTKKRIKSSEIGGKIIQDRHPCTS